MVCGAQHPNRPLPLHAGSYILHFEPSLDALSLRSDVISSINRSLLTQDGWEEVVYEEPKDQVNSSVPLNLVSSLLVLKQDLQNKLTVHLRLNIFNDETKLNSNRARVHSPVISNALPPNAHEPRNPER